MCVSDQSASRDFGGGWGEGRLAVLRAASLWDGVARKATAGAVYGVGGSEQDKKAGNGKGRNIDEPEKPGFGLGQA